LALNIGRLKTIFAKMRGGKSVRKVLKKVNPYRRYKLATIMKSRAAYRKSVGGFSPATKTARLAGRKLYKGFTKEGMGAMMSRKAGQVAEKKLRRRITAGVISGSALGGLYVGRGKKRGRKRKKV